MSAKARPVAQPPAWRNRIVGSGEEDPTQLLANPANWRRHPAEQRAALRGSLSEIGWVQQVLVNRTTGHLVDGHARVEEAISQGEPRVPVLYVELTEAEERLVLASLDPLAAMATAEKDALAALLAGIETGDEALSKMLAELADRNGIRRAMLGDPDEVPPVPEPEDVYAKPGDLWLLGDHRLLCGDATNPEDVARLLEAAQPTLLATDPPYGVSLDPTWRDAAGYDTLGPAAKPYMQAGRKLGGDGSASRRTKGHRNTSVSGDTRPDWSEAFELVPSLTVAYVWHASRHAAEVEAGLDRIGFEIRQQIIWVKNLAVMSRQAYHWRHEPCFYAVRQGATARWFGDRTQTTVWEAPSPKMIMAGSTEEKQDHPTQKPVLLFETPIRNHLRAGEACYDPFIGSGTTLVAAETLGRRCLGMEIEPRFVQQTIERWQGLTGQKAKRVDG